MIDRLGYLRQTPSQTVDPYAHIEWIPRQAGSDIFADNFVNRPFFR
jgi:hypothetical protein